MRLSAVFILLLVFSLAACSSDEPELTEPEEIEQENESEEGAEVNATPPQNQNLTETEETNQTPSDEENEQEEEKETRRDERKDDEEPEDKEPEEEEETEKIPPAEQNETQQTNLTRTQEKNTTQETGLDPPEEDEENSEQQEDKNDDVKVKEVTLTPDERGDLEPPIVSTEVLENLKMTEYPGYTEDYGLTGHTGYSGKRPSLQSLYMAGYGYDGGADLIVMTMVFNPENKESTTHRAYSLKCGERECSDAFMEEVVQSPIEIESDRYRFLIKGETVVYVRGNDKISSERIDDVTGKLSRRLGMKIVDFQEVLQRIKLRNCNIQNNLECTDYFVKIKNGKIELALKNNVGSEIEIQEVAVTSDAIIGRKCTTGQIDKQLLPGREYKFELNLTETGSRCEYDESSREKTVPFLADPNVDLYSVSIKHITRSRPQISFITRGVIITKKP